AVQAEAGAPQRVHCSEGLVDIPQFQKRNIGRLGPPAAPNLGVLCFGHVRYSFVMNRFVCEPTHTLELVSMVCQQANNQAAHVNEVTLMERIDSIQEWGGSQVPSGP